MELNVSFQAYLLFSLFKEPYLLETLLSKGDSQHYEKSNTVFKKVSITLEHYRYYSSKCFLNDD